MNAETDTNSTFHQVDSDTIGQLDKTDERKTGSTPASAATETRDKDLSGYSAGGNADTNSAGSSGDPTDEENLEDATTGPASAPGYGVINSDD